MIAWSWGVRARAEVCDCRFTLGKPCLNNEAAGHRAVQLTMKTYTDASQSCMAAGLVALPALGVGNPDPGFPKNCPMKIIMS